MASNPLAPDKSTLGDKAGPISLNPIWDRDGYISGQPIATPPCVRVRTRFELVTLTPFDQGSKSGGFEIRIGTPDT